MYYNLTLSKCQGCVAIDVSCNFLLHVVSQWNVETEFVYVLYSFVLYLLHTYIFLDLTEGKEGNRYT
jgi:hypothetical protein